MKKTIRYDISNIPVGSNSATGYICLFLGWDKKKQDIDFKDIILEIVNLPTLSNLQMLKAFVEDLISLERRGVNVVLINSFE